MKTLKFLLGLVSALIIASTGRAQFGPGLTNIQINGSSNQLLTGSTLTLNSGSTLRYQIGGTTNYLLYLSDTNGTVTALQLGSGMSISGGKLVAGSSSSANPSAQVGTTAVNGSATTFMTSDSAPAINLAMAPTWTGLHDFSYTSTITSGSDYGIEITPTLNQRNATNFSLIYGNETVTQAGTGNQYLEQLAVGGTNKWVVNSTGAVVTGSWTATVIGSAYGGAGTVNGVLYANGSGTVSAATNGSGVSISSGSIGLASIGNGDVLANISGSSNPPGDTAFSSVIDTLGSAQGSVLYRSGSGWTVLAPGTSGQVLTTLGGGNNPYWGAAGGAGSVTGSGLVSGQVAVANSTSSITSYAGFTATSGGALTVAQSLNLSGTAYSYGAASTTGATSLLVPATTYTLTGTTTTANFQATYFGVPTFTNASSQTLTTASTVYIAGAPAQAGSLTIGTGYALNVASGATNLQALTATTGVFSGGLNSTPIGATTPSTGAFTTLTFGTASGGVNVLSSVNSGTNGIGMYFNNTGGNYSVGTDNSNSTGITGSGNAYDAYVWNQANHNLVFGTHNALAGYFNGTTFQLGPGYGIIVPGTSTLTGNVTVGAANTVAGTYNLQLGNGGTTASYFTQFIINGTNAGNAGPLIMGEQNSVAKWEIGSSDAIQGGTSQNLSFSSLNSQNFYTGGIGGTLVLTLDTSQNATFAKTISALHYQSNTGTPGIAVGAAAGSGGSVGASISGTDQAGVITVTTGTSGVNQGILATVTFASSWTTAPKTVIFQPADSATAINIHLLGSCAFYCGTPSTTFILGYQAGSAVSTSTTYNFAYQVF